MAKLIIDGGHALSGSINVGGNKNAVLPMMAACLLTDELCVLTNVPSIQDVAVMAELLSGIGVEVAGVGSGSLRIRAKTVDPLKLDQDLVAQLRASVLFFGPLLARTSSVSMRHPGGCIIGRRGIDTHIEALDALGATLTIERGMYHVATDHLQGTSLFLSETSVTGTENALMAAVTAKGHTVIRNAASEPHVQALCRFLNAMGGNIQGIGSNVLTIDGVDALHGTSMDVPPDHIEVGTWIVAAAVTKGDVEITGVNIGDLEKILLTYRAFGVTIDAQGNTLHVHPSELHAVRKVETNVWPGFPTDLMSVTVTLATQVSGTTLCHDWMYEGRMFFVDKLIQMGANIILSDPHRALVTGPTPLRGKDIDSPDLRAGMALILAALSASGQSTIERAELIDRGYEKVDERLRSLGGHVERVDD
ncbi:MAG: UDP-N-acetylglucosamine 1-carboxyvinyltransferase [bacterium]|nr:UDP-N-acetylglucosamine 1-carboxyvinyltransferase [bacterium]